MPMSGPSLRSALHCSSRTARSRRGVNATQSARTPSPWLMRRTKDLHASPAKAVKPQTDA